MTLMVIYGVACFAAGAFITWWMIGHRSRSSQAEAIAALLALPDAPDMKGRTHHRTQIGSQDPWSIKQTLGATYVARRWQDHHEVSEASTARAALKVVNGRS